MSKELENAYKEILEELIETAEQLLNDPEIQEYIPKKYKPLITIVLKILKVIAKTID